jgi:hypothetical protein
MIPFEYSYGRKCNTLVSWENPTDKLVLGPESLRDMEDQMVKIKHNLKAVQDRQKIYANNNKIFKEFKVGENVFLKLNPKNISLKLGNCTKLAANFYGPFEILDTIRPVAYMLAFPTSMNVHNVFPVPFMKTYVHDPKHVIELEFDSGGARRRLSRPASAHLGQKIQNALELSHRTGPSSMELLPS